MKTAYKNISVFFTLILAFAVWGFVRTYLGLFPAFTSLTTVHHFYSSIFLSWFAILIIKPILIRCNKIEWHKNWARSFMFRYTSPI